MRSGEARTPAPRDDGVVTALASKRGRSDRLVVYVDGTRAFDIASAVAETAGLRVGAELTAHAQAGLLEQDAPYRARERALRLLALRDRSCREIEERLHTAGYDAQTIAGVVVWLRDLDYLNDARFSAGYATAKLKSGWGRRRVAAELLQKGVERRLVDEALGGAAGDDQARGIETVVELARRRFGSQFHCDPEGAARRLAGFLGRRGYDWDTIHAVTRMLAGKAAADAAASPSEDRASSAG